MGWAVSGWVDFFSVFGALGWVASSTAKVLKIWKDFVSAIKARLHKIWLYQAVKIFNFTADKYREPIRRTNKVNVSQWQLDHNDVDLEVLDTCVHNFDC